MADRCGFFIHNNQIIQTVVSIDWDLGYNPNAKLMYVERLYVALQKAGCSNIIDVTTANISSQYGCSLSPFHMQRDGMSVEDLYHSKKEQLGLSDVNAVLFYDWLYLTSLTQQNLDMISRYDCFTDVFHRPGNIRATQAKTCVIAKLLMQQDKLDLIKNAEEFYKWRLDNISIRS